MTKGLLFAASLVSLALSPVPPRHAGLVTSTESTSARGGVTAHPAPSDSLTVILLGTGVGPVVNLRLFGACIRVVGGG